MATNERQVSRAQRVAGLAAIGVLAVATALAFGRVYVGHGPTWKLLAAALASLGVAAVLQRRSLVVAALASAACLLVAIGLLVFPATTWHGLPSVETLRVIGQAFGQVGEEARTQIAPALPAAPLMLAGISAIWTAVFSAHTLAIRAGSPLLAVLPPVALVGFTDTVLADGARFGYAVVFLVAVLLVALVDGLRRIRQWGPIWSATRHPVSSATGRGAQQVALLAVAVATLAPGILPGFRSDPLVDFSTANRGAVHLNPFVSIRAQLTRKESVELFRVSSVDTGGRPVPTYWRLYALDDFDGTTWRSSDPQAETGRILRSPAQLSYSPSATEPIVRQQYRITIDLRDRWLPMAYPPELLVVPFESVRYDSNLSAALAPESLDAGTEYSVTSRYVSPTAEQLDQVTFGPASDYGGLTLASNVSAEVGKIARRWTRSATSPYRKVLAIQRHFLSGSFRYSLDVRRDSGSDALLEFLTETRKGFCQQFATAMAVMVRELGLPARVAVGFLPGTRLGTTFTVSTEQAHAWVEVLFPGYGWLPFDPTPGRANPLATPGSYLNPRVPETCPPGRPNCGTGAEASATERMGPVTGPALKLLQEDGFIGQTSFRPPRVGTQAQQSGGFATLYRLLIICLLALGGLLLVAIPAVKAVWRRARLGGGREPTERILAAFRVFDGRAADLRLGRATGETMAEYRDRLDRTVEFSDGHLERLTEAASRAAYGKRPLSEEEAREALRDAAVAIRDIRRDVGTLRRVLGTYRLGV
ncbi:MAG: transglutaminaseTgpA domain-containing protein [Actinomycetota bacterium]